MTHRFALLLSILLPKDAHRLDLFHRFQLYNVSEKKWFFCFKKEWAGVWGVLKTKQGGFGRCSCCEILFCASISLTHIFPYTALADILAHESGGHSGGEVPEISGIAG